ncbi:MULTISPECIES: GNAT family N-acetyltransferase [unclassified Streptomyces]|uniref:GNAT family N-acetyltransferase n=1 Tax=unclassified Streptomyces TaxID=2593676 RepID=UPI0007C504E1|nr:GNAT family N-acetyltransferase [Streptomyces sp. NRRL F-2747]
MSARTARPTAPYGIRRPRPAETGAVAVLLARAFADDAVMAWMFPDAAGRARRAARFFGLAQRQQRPRAGAVRVAATAGGRLLAAALWSGPGHWRPSAARELAAMPRYAYVFGVRGLSRAAGVQEALHEAHPDTPHWYLPTLGTDPAFQGTGVGSALVREQLAHCDRLGQPAYLESSMASNIPFYEGLGFRVTGEIRLPDGGPTLWPMWRDAGAPRGG